MAITKVTGALVDIGDLDLTNVGTLHLDSIVSDASPAVITIGHGSNDKLRIDGTVGLGTDAHDTQALHILSSARHLRLENAGSPGEIGLIGLLENGQFDIWAHGDNSTDIITFRTGSSTGIERVRIGQGETVINEASNDYDFRVESNDNSHMLFVDAGANTVNVGSTVSEVRVNQRFAITEAAQRGGMAINSFYNNAAGPLFDFNVSRNNTAGSHTVVQDADALGTFIWRGDDGDEFVDAAAIEANVDGTPGNGDMPGRLVFYTSPDGTDGLAERMRIQNSGITQFTTGDGNSGIAEFLTNASSGNTTCYISIRPQGTSRAFFGNGSSLLSGADVSDVILRSEANLVLNSGGNSESLRLDSNGHVTMPKQSSAGVKMSLQSNVAATPTTLDFDDEKFDQNSDFNTSTNTFTAPVTGKYLVCVDLYILNIDTAADYYQLYVSSSNNVYYSILDPGGLSSDPVYWNLNWAGVIDMDASDTVYFRINQSGGTAQTDYNTVSYASITLLN